MAVGSYPVVFTDLHQRIAIRGITYEFVDAVMNDSFRFEVIRRLKPTIAVILRPDAVSRYPRGHSAVLVPVGQVTQFLKIMQSFEEIYSRLPNDLKPNFRRH